MILQRTRHVVDLGKIERLVFVVAVDVPRFRRSGPQVALDSFNRFFVLRGLFRRCDRRRRGLAGSRLQFCQPLVHGSDLRLRGRRGGNRRRRSFPQLFVIALETGNAVLKALNLFFISGFECIRLRFEFRAEFGS